MYDPSSLRNLSNVDLRLIRVFRAVVQCGGFSAAQVHLNVSASKISMDIRSLEERHGYRLCRRGKAGFELTDEGRAVYEASERLIAAIESFASETRQANGKVSGILRVGLLDALSTDPAAPVGEAIRLFNARQHDVHLVLKIGTPQDLQYQILDDRIQVGVLSTLRRLPQLDYQPIHKERHYFYCGRGHPLFDVPDEEISIDRVREMRVVARSYWEYQELGNVPVSDPAATVEQMEGELILILSGSYLGFLPAHLASNWERLGRLRAINPEQIFYEAPFFLVTKRSVPATPALAAFLADFQAAFAAAGPDQELLPSGVTPSAAQAM